MSATVGAIERALFDRFPREWAEGWDRVGLLAGDPSWSAERVLVSLDPTLQAIGRAADAGASVLVTHHPSGLTPIDRLVPGADHAGVLFAAVRAGVALIAEHTNVDRAPEGVRALPNLLGLEPVEAVERSVQAMSRVTCFVPAGASEAIVSAMSAAGAGRVGAYERCAFRTGGEGEFVPRAGSHSAAGDVGARTNVEELRVEMVCPRSAVGAVVAAARAAHPYEEPLIVADEVTIGRATAAFGMRCAIPGGTSLAELARRAADAFGVAPRVWGDPSRRIESVATATGSASSLIPAVRASGAEALVCGEVRYHDALNAAGEGLAIIECGHDVTEWPLVPVLAEAVRSVPGMRAEDVIIDKTSSAWWTA